MTKNNQASMPGTQTNNAETLSERDRELMRRRIGILGKRPTKYKKSM